MSVTHVDPLQALVAFLFWLGIAVAIGMLVGRILRINDRPAPYDQERDTAPLGELLHFDCERRTRRDMRNGLGGAA